MPRHHAPDDYEDDPEEPDESDMDDDQADEFAETIECPHCGRDIHNEAQQCPHCRTYLSHEDSRPNDKPRWIIWTTLVMLALIIYGWIKWGSWL